MVSHLEDGFKLEDGLTLEEGFTLDNGSKHYRMVSHQNGLPLEDGFKTGLTVY